MGAAPVRRPRDADRHRRHVRHGRRRRAAARDRRRSPTATTCACWSTRRTRSARSARTAAAPSPRPASRARSTSSPARSARRSAPTAASSACDHVTARFLVHSARTLLHSTALPPVAAAAAMAALDLLEEQPRRVDEAARERRGAARRPGPRGLRRQRRRRPRHPARRRRRRAGRAGSSTSRSSRASSPRRSGRRPCPEGTARVRLSVMASHTREELREAAVVLGRAALRAGFRPGAGVPVAAAQGAVFDGQRDAALARRRVRQLGSASMETRHRRGSPPNRRLSGPVNHPVHPAPPNLGHPSKRKSPARELTVRLWPLPPQSFMCFPHATTGGWTLDAAGTGPAWFATLGEAEQAALRQAACARRRPDLPARSLPPRAPARARRVRRSAGPPPRRAPRCRGRGARRGA